MTKQSVMAPVLLVFKFQTSALNTSKMAPVSYFMLFRPSSSRPLCEKCTQPNDFEHEVKGIYIHCSKHLREQTFKAIYLEIYWEKSFQIVVLFSRFIVLDNAVVAEKNSKTLFFTQPRGESHPKTQVYPIHCDHDLYPFKQVQTP